MPEKSKNGRKAVDLGTHETLSQLREGASELILEESIFFKNIDFINKQVKREREQKKVIMHRVCSRLINDWFLRAYSLHRAQ